MADYKKYLKEVLSGLLVGLLLAGTGTITYYCMTAQYRVRNCAQEIKEKLLQARDHAANHKTFVAMIFPHSKDGVAPELAHKSLRICEITVKDSGKQTFTHRKWLCDWHRFPEGATVTEQFRTTYQIEAEKESFCNCVIFNPRGALHEHRPVTLELDHKGRKQILQIRITGMCKIKP